MGVPPRRFAVRQSQMVRLAPGSTPENILFKDSVNPKEPLKTMETTSSGLIQQEDFGLAN